MIKAGLVTGYIIGRSAGRRECKCDNNPENGVDYGPIFVGTLIIATIVIFIKTRK